MRPSASLPSTKRQNLLRDLEDNCFAVSQERSLRNTRELSTLSYVERSHWFRPLELVPFVLRPSAMSTDANREPTNPLPLAILFEGRSQKLTTLLHTTIAIWVRLMQSAYLRSRNRVVLLQLVVLVHDRDGFLFVPFRYNHWTSKFVFYLAAMFAAICQTALAMGVLSLNLRPATPENWRRRSCLSGLALFLIDMMALEYMQYAVDSIFIRHACSFAWRLRLQWPCV